MYELSKQEQRFIQALRWTLDDTERLRQVIYYYFYDSDTVAVSNNADAITNKIMEQWVVNGNSITEIYYEA